MVRSGHMGYRTERHGVSRKTLYKWIERFEEQGVAGLEDQVRRMLGEIPSPRESSAKVFSPETIRPNVSLLKSTVNTRRPSAFRANSAISSCLPGSNSGPQSV